RSARGRSRSGTGAAGGQAVSRERPQVHARGYAHYRLGGAKRRENRDWRRRPRRGHRGARACADLRPVLSRPRAAFSDQGNGHGTRHCQGNRGGARRTDLGGKRAAPGFGVLLYAGRRGRRQRELSAGKILVVDDDPQIRRVMKATLVGHNYEVLEARTGEDALEMFAREAPSLVLLDMNMPGIGGLETCRALRAGSDVPVIVLTVRNSEKDKVAALDAGADDYVTKPFGIEELLARIRAALRRSPT